MDRRLRTLALSSLLLLLSACGGDSEPRAPLATFHDFTAGLDLAEVQREPGLVDLGTPGARPLLRGGWAQDEADGGRTFVWSDGPESEIEFFVASPRDIPLTLRGQPYQAEGTPPQEVILVLNGETVGRVAVAGESRTVLPERYLREGMNRLALRYAWTRSPGNGDRRQLAMAWDLLRFETGIDEQARLRAAGGQLSLPFGWRIDSFLRLPEGAVLSLEGLRSRDGHPGELRVTLQPEGGEEQELARIEPDGETETIEIGGSGLVRLSLTAVPGEAGAAGSGLVLRRPILLVPKAADAKPAPAALTAARQAPRHNVILYMVDTLRADHLGCYGYDRPVSPRIDAFAKKATLFRHAVAQSPWTRPSVVTLLTGLLPRTHGVQRKRHSLAGEAVTLAETLKEQGYRTAGFVTNGNVARSFGVAQGFDTYELMHRKRSAATDVHARTVQWLDAEWKGDAPFFLYLHTVEPHAPYSPPAPFRQRFAPQVRDEALTRMNTLKRLQEGKLPATPEIRRDLLALYDAEIAANDAAFGDLLDLLVRRGLWEETVIVFVSDHGEEFLDHGGWDHGKTLHSEMLDIPLIVRIPGVGNGRTVTKQAQHADVLPTILDALGIQIPTAVEGRSLLPWMAGDVGPAETEEIAFSWLDEHGVQAASATTPDWRLIHQCAPKIGRSLYDRQTDPREQKDLNEESPVRAGYLDSRLKAGERPRQGALKAGQGAMDAELRQQLQALGYVH